MHSHMYYVLNTEIMSAKILFTFLLCSNFISNVVSYVYYTTEQQ